MRAFNRDRLNLVIGYFDILAVADLIALDDVRIADRLSGRSVEFAVLIRFPVFLLI
jgi:hypothetical protein